MNPTEYTQNALRTLKTFDKTSDFLKEDQVGDIDIIHALLGLSGEVGEVVDLFKKVYFYNKPVDMDEVEKEIGDVLWYLAILMDRTGLSFETVMQTNIDKLKARYPDKYSDSDAIAQADEVSEPAIITLGKLDLLKTYYNTGNWIIVNTPNMLDWEVQVYNIEGAESVEFVDSNHNHGIYKIKDITIISTTEDRN